MPKRVSNYRTKPIIIPDVIISRQSPQSLERLLLLCVMKSCYSYRVLSRIICPFDPKTQNYRPDFSTSIYNKFYPILTWWWDKFKNMNVSKDWPAPLSDLETRLYDRANSGVLTEDAQAIKADLWEDYTKFEFTPEFFDALINTDAFKDWLDRRVSTIAEQELSTLKAIRPITVQDWRDKLKQIETSLIPLDNNTISHPAPLMLSKIPFSGQISTGFPLLDKALGGGFNVTETTMIAGINGAGKSCLASQLTLESAKQNVQTVLLTTEQTPINIIQRIISNHTNTDFGIMINRGKDLDVNLGDTVLMDLVPEVMWKNPVIWDQLNRLSEIFDQCVKIINWSTGQGRTFETHFEQDMERLKQFNFNPWLVVVDWIGGGLEKTIDPGARRLILQNAVEHLVNFGKRTNKAVVVFTQLNKAKVSEQTVRVRQHMLSENMIMTNQVSNFIGMSALRSRDREGENFDQNQYFNVDKCRSGPGGLVPMEMLFKFQRFNAGKKAGLKGGGS